MEIDFTVANTLNLFSSEAKQLIESIATVFGDDMEEEEEIQHTLHGGACIDQLSIIDSLTCNVCNLKFNELDIMKEHFKTDWHRFNLKRRFQGKASLSVEEFENMASDISSLSGSDSEEEDEGDLSLRRLKYVPFVNKEKTVLLIHKCILVPYKRTEVSHRELISRTKNLLSEQRWILILYSAGHFAAAVYEGTDAICHKTFHSYVVRAKQGFSQNVKDSKGQKPKSAGASLRRENLLHLNQKIVSLFNEWSLYMEKANLIFLKASASCRPMLFNALPNLTVDQRIRHIPFCTCRPTFNEVKRVFQKLRILKYIDSTFLAEKINRAPPSRLESNQRPEDSTLFKVPAKALPKKTVDDVIIETVDAESLEKPFYLENGGGTKSIETGRELAPSNVEEKVIAPEINIKESQSLFDTAYTFCQTGDIAKLENLLSTHSQSEILCKSLNYRIQPEQNTLLHLCSELGFHKIIYRFLEAGADPSLKNNSNKTPYALARNKDVKYAFRLFMTDYPDRYDYAASGIFEPLTADELKEKKLKQAAKKQNQRKARLAKERLLKEQRSKERNEEAEIEFFLSLTDEDKVRYESCTRCFVCGKKISASAFSYYNFKFCSINCLRIHRFSSKKE